MPELPEIEVILRGIAPHIVGNKITNISIHTTNLRWPISTEIKRLLPGQPVHSLERRGKYLVLGCPIGGVLFHLGMTGYLRIVPAHTILGKHDHFDMIFQNEVALRLNDVRRFGAVLWAGPEPHRHKLLADLGPEPLSKALDGKYIHIKSRKRRITVKSFIMDPKVIAGVGNIYANEILFHAGIHPAIPAGLLSTAQCDNLVHATQTVLTNSIRVGGTMLDFRDGTEKLGYFSQQFTVYGRGSKPCLKCTDTIQYQRIGQRSIYFCASCQDGTNVKEESPFPHP